MKNKLTVKNHSKFLETSLGSSNSNVECSSRFDALTPFTPSISLINTDTIIQTFSEAVSTHCSLDSFNITVSSIANSPSGSSSNTFILTDEERYDQWLPPSSDGISFAHFISYDGQPNVTQKDMCKREIPATNVSRNSPIPSMNYASSLSFLQSIFESPLNTRTTSKRSINNTHNNDSNVQGTDTFPSTLISNKSNQQHNNNSSCPYDKSPNRSDSLVSSTVKGEPVSKKLIRQKNREAARKCREKKKDYIKQLEKDRKELQQHITALRQENEALKSILSNHLKSITQDKRMTSDKCPILLAVQLPSTSSQIPGPVIPTPSSQCPSSIFSLLPLDISSPPPPLEIDLNYSITPTSMFSISPKL